MSDATGQRSIGRSMAKRRWFWTPCDFAFWAVLNWTCGGFETNLKLPDSQSIICCLCFAQFIIWVKRVAKPRPSCNFIWIITSFGQSGKLRCLSNSSLCLFLPHYYANYLANFENTTWAFVVHNVTPRWPFPRVSQTVNLLDRSVASKLGRNTSARLIIITTYWISKPIIMPASLRLHCPLTSGSIWMNILYTVFVFFNCSSCTAIQSDRRLCCGNRDRERDSFLSDEPYLIYFIWLSWRNYSLLRRINFMGSTLFKAGAIIDSRCGWQVDGSNAEAVVISRHSSIILWLATLILLYSKLHIWLD